MRLTSRPVTILAAAVLAVPLMAAAQEPVRSFDQLDTRLKPGDTLWVTDAQGRESKGTLKGLTGRALTLKRWRTSTIDAADILAIDARRPDSTRNGTLIGLAVGEGLAAVCYAAGVRGGDPETIGFAELGFVLFGLAGADIGWMADSAIVGPRFAAYRAPAAGSAAGHRRLAVAPVITPRAKGVAVSLRF